MQQLRDQPGDGVCVAAALPGAGAGRVAGAKPGGEAASQPDRSGDGTGGAGVEAGTHALGTTETEADSGAGSARASLASGQYDRDLAEARRAGGGAQETAAHAGLHATAGACRRMQSRMVRRFQGLVSQRRRGAYRSVDDLRCLQPLSAALQTPASVYEPSPREYPARVPEPEYPSTMLVRA